MNDKVNKSSLTPRPPSRPPHDPEAASLGVTCLIEASHVGLAKIMQGINQNCTHDTIAAIRQLAMSSKAV